LTFRSWRTILRLPLDAILTSPGGLGHVRAQIGSTLDVARLQRFHALATGPRMLVAGRDESSSLSPVPVPLPAARVVRRD
jgi:hypothetical protein